MNTKKWKPLKNMSDTYESKCKGETLPIVWNHAMPLGKSKEKKCIQNIRKYILLQSFKFIKLI